MQGIGEKNAGKDPIKPDLGLIGVGRKSRRC